MTDFFRGFIDMALCSSRVYAVTTRCWYTLWNDHYLKSHSVATPSYKYFFLQWWLLRFILLANLATRTRSTVLLSVVTVLCIKSLWLVYLITGRLCFWLSSPTLHPLSPLATTKLSCLWPCFFVSIWFICFDSKYK